MKKNLTTLFCAAALLLGTAAPVAASEHEPGAIAVDAVVARPLCFAATVIGGAIFLVALPVAATSGSVHSTAHALVGMPAWATFKRPLGDFSYEDAPGCATKQARVQKKAQPK